MKHLALISALAGAAAFAQQPQMGLPRVQLVAGGHRIDAQVASTREQLETGLMHRSAMPPDEGMLFALRRTMRVCFWMKDTVLPLSIAFIAEDGTVVNIDEMAPQTLDEHCSAQPVRYVLEMNSRWLDGHGVKPPMKLEGLGPAR